MNSDTNSLGYERPVRLAIVGARGIGSVHARIFHNLGADIVGVAGSDSDTAQVAASHLNTSYGIKAQGFGSVTALLEKTLPDAVVIASPPHLHELHLSACLDRNLAVYCEKPLFWPRDDSGLAYEAISCLVEKIRGSGSRLLLNTPNIHFLAHLLSVGSPGKIKRFEFEFFTRGNASGHAIGIDLLPHGISMLQYLWPKLHQFDRVELSDIHIQSTQASWRLDAKLGWLEVRFDFRQDPNGPKHLMVAINGHQAVRVQEGEGATYKVRLSSDLGVCDLEDPFVTQARCFLDLLSADDVMWEAPREAALHNLTCCAELLLKPTLDSLLKR